MTTMVSRVAFSGQAITPEQKKFKVVVVGNGIGGVSAGRELGRLLHKKPDLADVTIVAPQDVFLFKPQLHETLNGKKITVPMQKLFPAGGPVQFKQAEVTKISIDPASKILETTQGPLSFDYLILAVGGKTAYFNHEKNAKLYAISIEEPSSIDRLRASVVSKLETASKAAKGSTEQAQALSFVIVGGGATGVETAFELKHFAQDMIQKKFPTLKELAPKITIIEAMSDILNGFPDQGKAYVKKRLKDEGIEVLFNHFVQNIGEKGLMLSDKTVKEAPVEKEILTKDPIWVTGVRANHLVESLPVERLPGNQRVKVNQHLEVPNRPDIYVIGDAAAANDPKSNRPFPPMGQVAEQEGTFVGSDLFKKMAAGGKADEKRPAFAYKDKGTMFSVGPGDGFVYLFNKYFIKGRIANCIRQAAYYLKTWRP